MVSILPLQVKLMLALREHRMHHLIWHSVRDNWERIDDESLRDGIRAMGWEPLRPSVDKNRNRIENNRSGEDFLFMHKHMLLQDNTMLTQIQDPSYPKVEEWNTIPSPGDFDYPVPVWNTAPDIIKERKTAAYYDNFMVGWENDYTNPEFLSQLTLGQLGSKLEYTIHNAMHLRWASDPVTFRPSVFPTNAENIDLRWDDPTYDYLADTYSSHVNPIFWKLHGWIDERIGDWMKAHQVTGDVPWSVQWDKNMMPQHTIVHGPHLMARMSEVAEKDVNRMVQVANIISKVHLVTPFSVIDDGMT